MPREASAYFRNMLRRKHKCCRTVMESSCTVPNCLVRWSPITTHQSAWALKHKITALKDRNPKRFLHPNLVSGHIDNSSQGKAPNPPTAILTQISYERPLRCVIIGSLTFGAMLNLFHRGPTKSRGFSSGTLMQPRFPRVRAEQYVRMSTEHHQYSKEPEPYPTVLVAADNGEKRQPLVCGLRQDNCLVLEADSLGRVLDVVKVHSRPIHLLLLDVQIGDAAWATLLNRYRPDMQILFVMSSSHEVRTEALPPHAALAKARELLKLPK